MLYCYELQSDEVGIIFDVLLVFLRVI